jgi:hypothetical protein
MYCSQRHTLTLELGSETQARAKVMLTSDSTSASVGQLLNVDIQIETGTASGILVSKYSIVVDFDPTKLSVRDADSATAGTQVEFLDSLFQVEPGTNNVTAAGRITLSAKSPSATSYAINRKVARITFQTLETGTTTISLPSGSTGNQLVNQNGIALPLTLNSVTLSIGAQASTSTSATTTATVSSGGQTTSSTSSSTSVIPNTALSDDILSTAPLLVGVLMLIIGVALRKSKDGKTA